jgi:hypothetical protein
MTDTNKQDGKCLVLYLAESDLYIIPLDSAFVSHDFLQRIRDASKNAMERDLWRYIKETMERYRVRPGHQIWLSKMYIVEDVIHINTFKNTSKTVVHN